MASTALTLSWSSSSWLKSFGGNSNEAFKLSNRRTALVILAQKKAKKTRKVILKEDVEYLGKMGQLLDVKAGFFQEFFAAYGKGPDCHSHSTQIKAQENMICRPYLHEVNHSFILIRNWDGALWTAIFGIKVGVFYRNGGQMTRSTMRTDGTSRDEDDNSNNNMEVESNLEGDLEEN